jgi:hypothetical protein
MLFHNKAKGDIVRLTMSYQSRRELLVQVVSRYREATHKQKSIILNEFIASSGYARKYAIRLLTMPVEALVVSIQRPRQRSYGAEVQEALQILWGAANFIGSKRLAPFLEELVPVMERHGHLEVTEEVRAQLLSISPATIDRILHPFRKSGPKGVSTTKSGILLKKQILLRTFSDWNETGPGFFEADLVAHCGHSTDGAYLNTFVLTDIATGWVECLPLLFRSRHAVIECLDYVRKILPFPLLGLDTDNGSEFINADLLAYCEREKITFTRGRAYKKNDQCYVEQKNGVVVRQLVGYDRFEGEGAYLQLRELYRAVRLYVNFFQPSMKLHEKHRNGGKVQKIYYPAKTPFQRLRAALGTDATESLYSIYQALDPVELLRQIRILQDALWKHAVLRTGDLPPEKNGTVCLPDIQFERAALNLSAQNERKSISRTVSNNLDQQKRKYRRTKAIRVPHTWRTREDPFHQVWNEICERLEKNPERTAKSLFLEFQKLYPDQYHIGQLRTLQRRIQEWRAKTILTFDNRWLEEGQLFQEGLPRPLGVKVQSDELTGE